MPTFVIVHGAFGGGWEWTGVAQLLRARGHDVFTPTLTGLGERAHLAGPHVDLTTHVSDLRTLLDFEELDDVLLCAASYGGMPATVAADRAPERVRLLTYIDALVPRDGESALDLLPAAFAEDVRAAAASGAEGWWRVEVPPAVLPPAEGLAAELRDRYVARLRPQPARTFMEPVRLRGAIDRVPRAFVRCTGYAFGDGMGDPVEPFAQRARRQGWPYHELPLPHDPHLFAPDAVAKVLDELAEAASPSAAAKRRAGHEA